MYIKVKASEAGSIDNTATAYSDSTPGGVTASVNGLVSEGSTPSTVCEFTVTSCNLGSLQYNCNPNRWGSSLQQALQQLQPFCQQLW